MNTFEYAYRRSAYPRLGITLEQVMAAPALRGTLEIAQSIARLRTKQAAGAGRYIERTAQ